MNQTNQTECVKLNYVPLSDPCRSWPCLRAPIADQCSSTSWPSAGKPLETAAMQLSYHVTIPDKHWQGKVSNRSMINDDQCMWMPFWKLNSSMANKASNGVHYYIALLWIFIFIRYILTSFDWIRLVNQHVITFIPILRLQIYEKLSQQLRPEDRLRLCNVHIANQCKSWQIIAAWRSNACNTSHSVAGAAAKFSVVRSPW